MPSELKLIPVELLDPHPDNPRVVIREDVVAAIAANLNGEFPQKHALHVRPTGKRYQTLSGHTRTEAARRKGLTHVWAWVEDLDDRAAFMELVTSNSQGELSPLEIGIHALKAVPKEQGRKGGGLKVYAKGLGKSERYVGQLWQAAEVLTSTSEVDFRSFLDRTQHLVALHALPRACWQAVCEWLATADDSAADVGKKVAKALEFRESFDPGEWTAYLPADACTAAVFTGEKEPTHFRELAAFAGNVAESLADHPDLVAQWRDWLNEFAGADSWDKGNRNLKANELQEVAAERDAADDGDTEDTHNVLHGDFREIAKTVPDDSVDLIFTDPPYHREYLPLYGDLAAAAARVLKPGGSLVCYLGHYNLRDVLNLFEPHLRFWWPLCCLHTGQSARMTEYGIVVKWKPMLWFVKETRGDKRTFVDDLVASRQEKATHEWQQSVEEAGYYIDKLTLPGETVFDPFCGGGTTAVAAKAAGRKWLTCDVDPEAVSLARKRVGGAGGAA
jgi:SAM-dependent methyltransferase